MQKITKKSKFMRTAFPKGTAYGVVPLTAQESGGSANTATPLKSKGYFGGGV